MEMRSNRRCHCEPVRTLVWQSPGSSENYRIRPHLPFGHLPLQGKAWSHPYIINKCKFACIILLRRLDVNQNQAYLATTAAIRSNCASMSDTSLNWVRALSRFCSG